MWCANSGGSKSEEKFYRFEAVDDNYGLDLKYNSFAKHAQRTVTGEVKWNFSKSAAQECADDPTYVAYRKSWADKWSLVRDIMCGPDFYNSEPLD